VKALGVQEEIGRKEGAAWCEFWWQMTIRRCEIFSDPCSNSKATGEFAIRFRRERKLCKGLGKIGPTQRFFYVQVLKRGWSVAETPYPKKVLHLPQVLSQDEVARLIDAAEFPFHRILLMTLYATGARRGEVAHLKISDIDSQRMVIHIRGGKGRKDRDVMLSPKLLDALRVYWRGLKRKPTDWLFPGNRWHTASHPQAVPTIGFPAQHGHPETWMPPSCHHSTSGL